MSKKSHILISFILFFVSVNVSAQMHNPVTWNYTAKKIADKTYEVHLTASVKNPWHIYSQSTPEGGPIPTKIIFKKNPLVIPTGKAKEKGKLLQKHEEVFDVDVKYFDGNVDFVQVVKLKSNVKTNVSGTIEFMACNDEQCLPPTTVPFTVTLQ